MTKERVTPPLGTYDWIYRVAMAYSKGQHSKTLKNRFFLSASVSGNSPTVASMHVLQYHICKRQGPEDASNTQH